MDEVREALNSVSFIGKQLHKSRDQIDPKQFEELNNRLDGVMQKLEEERALFIQKNVSIAAEEIGKAIAQIEGDLKRPERDFYRVEVGLGYLDLITRDLREWQPDIHAESFKALEDRLDSVRGHLDELALVQQARKSQQEASPETNREIRRNKGSQGRQVRAEGQQRAKRRNQ